MTLRFKTSLFVCAALACSDDGTPAAPSGLFVTIAAADVYSQTDFDSLQITAGTKVVTRSLAAGDTIGLPTSISVVGAPGTETKVEVRALLHGIVRLAAYAKTTIPDGRFGILPITLSAACRDRCVQVQPSDPLSSYCDPTSLACVNETITGTPAETLATYDPGADPTAGLKSVDCGGGTVLGSQTCNGSDTGGLTCTSVMGEASMGDLSCVGCRGVTSSTCSAPNGLAADAVWSTFGGSTLREGRSPIVGPKSAPPLAQSVNATAFGGSLSGPVITKDGAVWFTSSGLNASPKSDGNFAGVVLALRGITLKTVYQPGGFTDCRLDKTAYGGTAACRLSQPIVADDGAVWTQTNTGVTFRFTSPDSPAVQTLEIGLGCVNISSCNFSEVGPFFRNDAAAGRLAYLPSGDGFFTLKISNLNTVLTPPFTAPYGLVQQCPTWGDAIPSIGPDGTIYLGVNDVGLSGPGAKSGVCAISPAGQFLWHSPPTQSGPRTPSVSSPVIGPDGTIYFGSADHLVYALDPKQHDHFKWTAATGGATAAPSLGVDGTLYVGSADGYLYAFDPDGKTKWSLEVKGTPAQSLVDADGTLYFGTDRGILYAISPNGAKLWQSIAGTPIVHQPAIGADGTLYFGSTEGFVFALSPTSG